MFKIETTAENFNIKQSWLLPSKSKSNQKDKDFPRLCFGSFITRCAQWSTEWTTCLLRGNLNGNRLLLRFFMQRSSPTYLHLWSQKSSVYLYLNHRLWKLSSCECTQIAEWTHRLWWPGKIAGISCMDKVTQYHPEKPPFPLCKEVLKLSGKSSLHLQGPQRTLSRAGKFLTLHGLT